MIRILLAAAVFAGLPAFAQAPSPVPQAIPQAAWTNEVDPAAIFMFDPDGGAGIPLTADAVRAYLSAPIAAPTAAQRDALNGRRRTAEAAKAVILSDEKLFAPLWTENAFELQDGSIREMSLRERAVFAELDAVDAGQESLNALRILSQATDRERAALAEALVYMLDAGVRLAGRNSDGYRKFDADWAWVDFEEGVIISSRRATPEAEIALLRWELARSQLLSGITIRTSRPVPAIGNVATTF